MSKAKTRVPSDPKQIQARINEIDAWISTSHRHRYNVGRVDRAEWHAQERTRLRRERSKLVRALARLGIVVPEAVPAEDET